MSLTLKSIIFILIGLVASRLAQAYTLEAQADQVTSLPGGENLSLTFNQFSGYLQIPGVDANTPKNMHYWLVESMSNPATDPVAFWTNGGPGCSGLIGFMTEQGPFRPDEAGILHPAPYAWNQKANMVFIESPCGVGFSYSDNKDDYKADDSSTALDNYNLIQAFMKRFPEYSQNPLFITSESYGGHYMPTLAKQIVDANKAGNNPILNFQGFAVGNPQTTFYSAIPSGLQTYWGHQVISKPTWDRYNSVCRTEDDFNAEKCETLFTEMFIEVGMSLNPYALDYPVCVSTDAHMAIRKSGRGQRVALFNHLLGEGKEGLKKAIGLEPENSYQPCEDNWATTYLNRADVKAALHVKDDIAWEECSRSIRYSQTDGMKSMVPIYQELLKKSNIRILVYSGDDDSVCPTEGTQSWIWDMGFRPEERTWKPYLVANQTAGYATKWRDANLAFYTVHGAGHECPTYKPEASLYLFNSYISNTL